MEGGERDGGRWQEREVKRGELLKDLEQEGILGGTNMSHFLDRAAVKQENTRSCFYSFTPCILRLRARQAFLVAAKRGTCFSCFFFFFLVKREWVFTEVVTSKVWGGGGDRGGGERGR